MVDQFTFGASGTGSFAQRFSYHEIQYITIQGLGAPPAVGDVVGHRLTSLGAPTGAFSCSSPLITKMYDTTVNNYRGITTGGMTVDCPHRERRGYGGDGHTSYQFALANFDVGAFFTKWARDFADVQQPDGDVPHTAPTVSGGGGLAWSGFVVTMPYQTYLAYVDTALLATMYPTMARQLAFYAANTGADGLLHAWSPSQWEFLGDWITPHGSESEPSSPECVLFNNCYLHYITTLAATIARVLGKDRDAAMYDAAAGRLAAAINAAFGNPTSGVYLDMLQTHLVMPLAGGVVPPSGEQKTVANLERSIRVLNDGHLDTGLTGTYFMTKLLTEMGRNDLVFTYANQTTYPSYGYFLEQGFTTWPESWDAGKGVSKMHGCYNAIGLWFLQGVAGITVDMSDAQFPIRLRAGVDTGDVAWARASRAVPHGAVRSSWLVHSGGFAHNVTVPGNAEARVQIPALALADVLEGGRAAAAAPGVSVIGMDSVNGASYVALKVGSGEYRFASSWTRS